MNREDITRMAREAGMEQDGDNFFSPGHEEIDVHITDLERFAALVRADEREACARRAEIALLGGAKVISDHVLKAIRATGETK